MYVAIGTYVATYIRIPLHRFYLSVSYLVAHFHLHNGASLWRINWLADSSQLGMNRSYGIMVNYKYHLPDIATNANNYIVNGQLPLSSSVQQLL